MTARRVLFVAGSHTEIGKTHVACEILRAGAQAGWTVDALKPVVSGFDPDAWSDSDPGRLIAACGWEASEAVLARLSPWRYRAPLAPPLAAQAEGQSIDFAAVVEFCRRRIAESEADLMVVEGVGGLMSPIAAAATSLDLLTALTSDSVLVGGGYLGAVSHTLTALEVMRQRGLAPAALVISQSEDPEAPDFASTLALVEAHAAGCPVFAAPRRTGDPWPAALLQTVFGAPAVVTL